MKSNREAQKHSKRFKSLAHDFRASDGGGLQLFIHFQCVLSSAEIAVYFLTAHRSKRTAAARRYFWEEDPNQGRGLSPLKDNEGRNSSILIELKALPLKPGSREYGWHSPRGAVRGVRLLRLQQGLGGLGGGWLRVRLPNEEQEEATNQTDHRERDEHCLTVLV